MVNVAGLLVACVELTVVWALTEYVPAGDF